MRRAAWGGALLLGLALAGLALAGPARAVDVSQLSDFESDPCVMGLAERNTAQHVGAPDSALADACERAHGSIEVAWDFVLRMWKPPDVSATMPPARRSGAASALLGLVGMLLVYAVLGWPVRAIVTLLRPSAAALPGLPKRLAAEAALALVARLVIGTVMLLALTVPWMQLVGALVLLWCVTSAIRRRPRARVAEPPNGTQGATQASAVAEVLAGAVNDGAANLGSLLGLALAARGNWRLLAFGVLLAVAFSLPVVVQVWRRARASPGAMTALGILVAIGAGVVAVGDPPLARVIAANLPALGVVVPLAFALVVAWRGGAIERLRPARPRSEAREGPPQVPGP